MTLSQVSGYNKALSAARKKSENSGGPTLIGSAVSAGVGGCCGYGVAVIGTHGYKADYKKFLATTEDEFVARHVEVKTGNEEGAAIINGDNEETITKLVEEQKAKWEEAGITAI